MYYRDLEPEVMHQGYDDDYDQGITVSDDDDISSVVSIAASIDVHNQSSGTCFAHAAATGIRAAESRIVGRTPEPFDDLLKSIVAKFGSNGGFEYEVIRSLCKTNNLRYETCMTHDSALRALRDGFAVVAAFELSVYQWKMFTDFFQSNPTEVLSYADFYDLDDLWESDFPPELHKIEGHAVVIVGYYEDDGKTVYKIKNSWGTDFACNGYFYVESDAFPSGFDRLTAIFYYVSDLAVSDIRNFILDCLGRYCRTITVNGDGMILVNGRYFQLNHAVDTVEDTANEVYYFVAGTAAADHNIIAYIHDCLRSVNEVRVTENGQISVNQSRHTFRVAALGSY